MINEKIKFGQKQLIENIKILLYKKDSDIFSIIDFEDDRIYQEPLLFAYFNDKKSNNLNLYTILYGYMNFDAQKKGISVESDEYGRVYLPNIGWLMTNEVTQKLKLFKDKNSKIKLLYKGVICEYKLESIEKIDNTNIEYLRYPIPLLKQCYYDFDNNLINVEIERISIKHLKNVTKALNLIKRFAPKHFDLIVLATKKIVVFNVDTTLRNSFATLSAHGISFSNAYQEDYNEVFFIDDIAHQTGHIIFNALIYDYPKFIKINPDTILQYIELENITVETRNVHVVFYALYTYYATFVCLEVCLIAKVLDAKRTHEALGRLCFYLRKCHLDLNLFERASINDTFIDVEDIFTEKGLEIFFEIKNKFDLIKEKWRGTLKPLDMSNQPYNFTYSKFVELNPLDENNN